METIELAVIVTQIGGPTAYTDELALLRPNTGAFGRALFSSTPGRISCSAQGPNVSSLTD